VSEVALIAAFLFLIRFFLLATLKVPMEVVILFPYESNRILFPFSSIWLSLPELILSVSVLDGVPYAVSSPEFFIPAELSLMDPAGPLLVKPILSDALD